LSIRSFQIQEGTEKKEKERDPLYKKVGVSRKVRTDHTTAGNWAIKNIYNTKPGRRKRIEKREALGTV